MNIDERIQAQQVNIRSLHSAVDKDGANISALARIVKSQSESIARLDNLKDGIH